METKACIDVGHTSIVVGTDFVKGQRDFFHFMPHQGMRGSRSGCYECLAASRSSAAFADSLRKYRLISVASFINR